MAILTARRTCGILGSINRIFGFPERANALGGLTTKARLKGERLYDCIRF